MCAPTGRKGDASHYVGRVPPDPQGGPNGRARRLQGLPRQQPMPPWIPSTHAPHGESRRPLGFKRALPVLHTTHHRLGGVGPGVRGPGVRAPYGWSVRTRRGVRHGARCATGATWCHVARTAGTIGHAKLTEHGFGNMHAATALAVAVFGDSAVGSTASCRPQSSC